MTGVLAADKVLKEGREERTTVLGLEQGGGGTRGSQSSEPSWCNIYVFPIAKLMGDRMPTPPTLPFSGLRALASVPA